MEPLGGTWSGIAGGSNFGRVSASFYQDGKEVFGQFTFLDLISVPIRADFVGLVNDGRWIDGGLQRIEPTQAIPPSVNLPSTGRVLALIEENGRKISGFWITNVGTTGSLILLRDT